MNLQYTTIIFCGRFGGYILKYEHINIDQTLNSIFVCCSLKSMKRKMSVESEKLGCNSVTQLLIGANRIISLKRCSITRLIIIKTTESNGST